MTEVPYDSSNSSKALPSAASSWSWGGFLLTWIWGIRHSVWLSLLALLPGAGLVMRIILGLKGGEWAWNAKDWESEEEFKRVQRTWTIAGIVVHALILVLGAIGIAVAFFVVFTSVTKNPAYVGSLQTVSEDPQVRKALGAPIEKCGMMSSWSSRSSGPTTTAEFDYRVCGSFNEAVVHVEAVKRVQSWTLDRLEVTYEPTLGEVEIIHLDTSGLVFRDLSE